MRSHLKLLQLSILLSTFLSSSYAIFLEEGGSSPENYHSSSASSSSEEGYGGGRGHHHGHHHNGGHHHHPPPRPRPPPQKPKCEEGWYTSERPQGVWCMKVGLAKLDYQGSQAQCATMGAVLSGIQNDAERQFIVNASVTQLIPSGATIAGVWLGGVKLSGRIFHWTDAHTQGTEGMFWGPGQPNNGNGDPRGPQNCMQLIVMTPAYWSRPNKWRTFPNVIDDYWCHMTHDPPTRLTKRRHLKLLQLSILLSTFLSTSNAIFLEEGGGSSASSSSSEEGYSGGGGHHHGHHHGGGHHHHPPPRPRPPPSKPKCEEGWYTSERPQGVWCMKVGLVKLNYQGSQSQCATMGAVLSGIQNDAERQFIVNASVTQLIPSGSTIAGVWLGGIASSGRIFHWNDGNTQGTEGMFWGPGQPNNANKGSPYGPQNCMQLIVMTPAYWNRPGKWSTFPNVIDDYFCQMTHDPPTRLYVCGKRGPPENTIG